MFGYAFSKLAMTVLGLAVQLHHVMVTLACAAAFEAGTVNAPSRTATVAERDMARFLFISTSLLLAVVVLPLRHRDPGSLWKATGSVPSLLARDRD